ncbi:hypothetical protein ACMD2_02065 [Ananas comosus]|uniref:Uncharacterized protein n=1 Tax=Ananas comosus TaxID=4615 RepID=A0A199W4H8_ANACO|nr:hypothetical protein ACMD2_02065 [Ananas comosus]
MAGDEVGVKLVRFLYFVGAGVICTKAINLWRDYERKQEIAAAAAEMGESPPTPQELVGGGPAAAKS